MPLIALRGYSVKRFAIALVSLALVVAACGDDDAADPAALDSCEGMAAAGIDIVRDTIDLIDGLDAEGLVALSESDEPPPEFADLQRRGDELLAHATTIGCSDEEIATLVANRAGDLSADSVFGQVILEAVQSGEGIGFFGG